MSPLFTSSILNPVLVGRPLCTRPPMPEHSEGLRVRMTPRWREMDSNHRSPGERADFCCGRRIAGPNGGSQKGAFLMRYRWFESISLQRRVRCEPVSRGNPPSYVEKPRFSAGVRAEASGAVGRDAQDAATSGLRSDLYKLATPKATSLIDLCKSAAIIDEETDRDRTILFNSNTFRDGQYAKKALLVLEALTADDRLAARGRDRRRRKMASRSYLNFGIDQPRIMHDLFGS